MFKDNPNMIVKHHIDSYNQFFSTGYVMFLKTIILYDFLKNSIKKQIYISWNVSYKIYYGKPIIYDE